MTQLQQIMTKNIATVSPTQSVADAAEIMRQYNVGAVPVVQNGNCLGIITDRDISLRSTAKGIDAEATPVENVMTSNVIAGSPQMDAHEAVNVMAENQVRRLPVVENNQLTGMVSLGDVSVQNVYEDEAGQALSDISYPSQPRM